MTQRSRETGQQGEAIAQSILKAKGFRIEAVNWRSGKRGEIDLVAYHPRLMLLIFAEVKTRKRASFGMPVESVDGRKQAQLAALAELYLAAHPPHPGSDIRFDVISVYYPGEGRPAEIEHIENAFQSG